MSNQPDQKIKPISEVRAHTLATLDQMLTTRQLPIELYDNIQLLLRDHQTVEESQLEQLEADNMRLKTERDDLQADIIELGLILDKFNEMVNNSGLVEKAAKMKEKNPDKQPGIMDVLSSIGLPGMMKLMSSLSGIFSPENNATMQRLFAKYGDKVKAAADQRLAADLRAALKPVK